MNQKKICPDCGREFEQTGIDLGGKIQWVPVICTDCIEARASQAENDKEAFKQRALQRAWEMHCPPIYRESDRARLPIALLSAADSWQWGQKGLAFTGPAGAGKTRVMFGLLSGLHFSGKGVLAVSAVRLARYSADQFDQEKDRRTVARGFLELSAKADALFIDDIGKQKFTERAELDFFEILEQRTAHLLPTFWTANASGAELAAMLSEDRGEPIMRRLVEFSNIIKI